MIDLNDPDNATRLILNTFQDDSLLSDVQIKTLRSHYNELVAEQAYHRVSSILSSIQPNLDKVERRVQVAVEQQPPMSLKQFVDVPTDSSLPIVVCLDVPAVDNNMWIDVISILSTQQFPTGKTEFGEPIQFGKNSSPKITIRNSTIRTDFL